MSALPKIIEGTWEEVVRHAGELSGHRLKVIVLDQVESLPASSSKSPSAVEAWVADLRAWAYNRPRIETFVDDSRDTLYGDISL